MADPYGIKSEIDNMVNDPENGIVYLDKMKEKELLDLLVRLANKAKRIKMRHWERHGYLLGMGKVLEKLYFMNVHRWGRDDGKSGYELEAFENYFKDKLFGDFHRTNEVILEMLRTQKSIMDLSNNQSTKQTKKSRK